MTPKDLVVQYQKTPSKPPSTKLLWRRNVFFLFQTFLSKEKWEDAQMFLMVMVQLVVVLASTWVIYTVLHTMGTNKL